jgi:hypothetical protein
MCKMRAKNKVLVWSDFMFERVETLAAVWKKKTEPVCKLFGTIQLLTFRRNAAEYKNQDACSSEMAAIKSRQYKIMWLALFESSSTAHTYDKHVSYGIHRKGPSRRYDRVHCACGQYFLNKAQQSDMSRKANAGHKITGEKHLFFTRKASTISCFLLLVYGAHPR